MFFVKLFLELVFSKSLFSNLTSIEPFTEIVFVIQNSVQKFQNFTLQNSVTTLFLKKQ